MTNQRIFLFSSQGIETDFLSKNTHIFRDVSLNFTPKRLSPDTVAMAEGSTAVCAFVNDDLGCDVLRSVKDLGINLVLMRCAGFNNVDIEAAKDIGITVLRVPAYSPWAVAEHAVTLLLCLNRQYVVAVGILVDCVLRAMLIFTGLTVLPRPFSAIVLLALRIDLVTTTSPYTVVLLDATSTARLLVS
jgi:hypothetical protein